MISVGDPSTFDAHTALIVGPGFKEAFLPGYPANEESFILESDYEGRELREIQFTQGKKFGRFNAVSPPWEKELLPIVHTKDIKTWVFGKRSSLGMACYSLAMNQ